MISSVGHGPTGIDTAPPPGSVHVTRAATDACATASRRTKPTANSKITASLRRENGDWPRGHLRRQRDGVTPFPQSPALMGAGHEVLSLTGTDPRGFVRCNASCRQWSLKWRSSMIVQVGEKARKWQIRLTMLQTWITSHEQVHQHAAEHRVQVLKAWSRTDLWEINLCRQEFLAARQLAHGQVMSSRPEDGCIHGNRRRPWTVSSGTSRRNVWQQRCLCATGRWLVFLLVSGACDSTQLTR